MSESKFFQIFHEGMWKEFDEDTNKSLQRAYSEGALTCQYSLGGQQYECDFKTMQQKNLSTGILRSVRPRSNYSPPAKCEANTTVKVLEGSLGKAIQALRPKATGQTIEVQVPQEASVGQSLGAPVAAVREDTISNDDIDVKRALLAEKTARLTKDHTKSKCNWSTGRKIAVNTAAVLGVAGVAAGGVTIGVMIAEDGWEATADELQDVAGTAGESLLDAGEASLDWVADAGDKLGDFIIDLF